MNENIVGEVSPKKCFEMRGLFLSYTRGDENDDTSKKFACKTSSSINYCPFGFAYHSISVMMIYVI